MFDMTNVDEETYNKLSSRRDAIRKAGKLGAQLAVASMPVVFSAMPKIAKAQGTSIVDTLNFALTLEYLEAEFYADGLASSIDFGAIRPVIQQISKHENAHVQFLTTTINSLNGTPASKPEFDFTAGGTFDTVMTDMATFLAVAQAFEDTGVRAYKGQAPNLMSSDAVLNAGLRIHSVEARHAAEIRRIRGQKGWITGPSAAANGIPIGAVDAVYMREDNTTHLSITRDAYTDVASGAVGEAFDEFLTMDEVLDIAGLFIVS